MDGVRRSLVFNSVGDVLQRRSNFDIGRTDVLDFKNV